MNKHTPGYEITKDGQVFSVSPNWRGYGKREMTQTPNADGYPSVRIYVNGKRTHVSVYKLVALEYLPNRPSKTHEVRHLDGNKTNSRAENLAWGTRKENAQDREIHGRTSRGKSHSQAIKRGLEALERIVSADDNGELTSEEIENARAAIAKARGQG